MAKKPSDSYTVCSEMLLPNDTNTLGNMFGGKLMMMMDMTGAIAAQKHARRTVVTASADQISFRHPIILGDIITLEAKVTRAFRTSMEVHIKVWAENHVTGKHLLANQAFFTYVALNEKGIPTEVPELIPQTEEEKYLYETALQRRQSRLKHHHS
ncbi:MAG: acyl-CoA thioesterase [Cytophagales bacterium]|nr:acyl-CoA thioesterase [Cytophagales bacterium]MDW8384792.1 acyl-CoA thioesterase [Flammeovirgaceae bacterium]